VADPVGRLLGKRGDVVDELPVRQRLLFTLAGMLAAQNAGRRPHDRRYLANKFPSAVEPYVKKNRGVAAGGGSRHHRTCAKAGGSNRTTVECGHRVAIAVDDGCAVSHGVCLLDEKIASLMVRYVSRRRRPLQTGKPCCHTLLAPATRDANARRGRAIHIHQDILDRGSA